MDEGEGVGVGAGDAGHVRAGGGEGEGGGSADASTGAREEDDLAVEGSGELGGGDVGVGVMVSGDDGSRVSVEVRHVGHFDGRSSQMLR